jgi:hypothetical protein
MDRIYAVLTGDLVGSTSAGPVAIDRTFAVISQAANHLSQRIGERSHFSRFRGDGWQMLIYSQNFSLYACIYIVATLRATLGAVPTRIAVGIGTIDRYPSTVLETAYGEAFIESGRCLDAMPHAKRLAIAGDRFVKPWHRAILDLVEWQTGRWSPQQAEAVALSLEHDGKPQEILGSLIGISRQAMQARLSSAGRSSLDEALATFKFPYSTVDSAP